MKRTIGAAALAWAVVFCGASAALAQSAAQISMMEGRFKAADKDGDGKLTRDEAKAGMPRVSSNFDKIDKGGKGYVTLDEIKAAMAVMM
jgi:Ca2+-binding EF-hand superfamily protein